MRKIISVIVTVCVMMCSFGTDVSAYGISERSGSEISLMNLYTEKITTNLYRSGSDIVYKCSVTGKSTATEISIYLYLQEYVNGVWKSIDVVTKDATGRTANVSDRYSSAVSGRRYRTEAHVYVYSGSNCEYLEVNSGTIIF